MKGGGMDLHRSIALLKTFLCCLLLLGAAAPAQAEEFRYQMCARGLSETPAQPFTQSIRFTLVNIGMPIPDSLLTSLAEYLVKEVLWAGKAGDVYGEPDRGQPCAPADADQPEIRMQLTAADLAGLSADGVRGSALKKVFQNVAKSVSIRLGQETGRGPARHWLRVYYATNRNSTGNANVELAFGSARVNQPAFGTVDVAVPQAPRMRQVQAGAIFGTEHLLQADSLPVAHAFHPMPLADWKRSIAGQANALGAPGTLVFFHGFNVTFTSAARRAAQLAYDLGFPGAVVFFAWPADGTLPSYLRDGRDAKNSGVAAGKMLADLASVSKGPLYLVAHSMGNRVMTEGYLQMLELSPESRNKIREVVMAAPDLDQEEFRLYMANRLLPSGPRFTLYASANDLALGSSEFLQGGKRMGFGGEALFVDRNLDSIDASAVSKEFFGLNHSYFGDTTSVMADLYNLIRYRMPVGKRPNLLQIPRAGIPAWAITP